MSHLSGIRHYEKKSPFESAEENKSKSQGNESEFKNQEYLLNTFYESVSQSLTLFKDDELFSKPGILLWDQQCKLSVLLCCGYCVYDRYLVFVYYSWMDFGERRCGRCRQDAFRQVHEILFSRHGASTYLSR